MYVLFLTEAARNVLAALRVAISIGIDAVPLACLGFESYVARLIFWMLLPLVVILGVLIYVGVRAFSSGAFSARSVESCGGLVLRSCLPATLYIFFLAYPVVTNYAFEAFSCYEFDDGSRWLVADVSVACTQGGAFDLDTSTEHGRAKVIAWLAVLLYPIGVLVLNAMLLLAARKDLRAGKSTTLVVATAFLHGDYVAHFKMWELAEVLRRFLIVGLFVVGPYERGSIMQLALATLCASLFLVLQLVAMPYKRFFDNFLGLVSSMCLAVLFLAALMLKVGALTELGELQEAMSPEQRDVYLLDSISLGAVLLLSVIGAITAAAALLLLQFSVEMRRRWHEARAARARRLRNVDDGSEVTIGEPMVPPNAPPHFAPTYNMGAVSSRYHLFLSHVTAVRTSAHLSSPGACP